MDLQLKSLTDNDIRVLFNNNLAGLVADADLKKHLIDLAVRSMRAETLKPFNDFESAYLRLERWINDNDSLQAYNRLIGMGDAYLMLAGFYPEHLVMRHKGLDIQSYVAVGQAAYDYAVYAGNKTHGIEPPVNTAYKLGNYFVSAARALFRLRSRLDINVVLIRPTIINEISHALFNGRPIPITKEHERALLHPL